MNSSIFKSTFTLILATALLSETVFAQDISHEAIAVTTSLRQWNSFSIEQISDGISNDCAPTCNGFTTNAKTGLIQLNFNEPYDIDSFKLWNDVNIQKEGIRTFNLEFKNSSNAILTSQEFEAVSGQADVQVFTFPKIQNVISVKLNVLSSLLETGPTRATSTYAERIEVREVSFTGTPASSRLSTTIGDEKNNERIAALETENTTLESENANLESQIANLVSDKADLKTQITSLQSQLAAMEGGDETGPLLEEITNLRDKIQTLEAQLANVDDSSNPNSGLVKEIADLKFQNTNQTETINKLNQMLKDPLESLEERDNVIEAQTQDIEKLNADITELKSKPSPTPTSQPPRWPWQVATAALGALAIGLGTALLRKPKTPPRPPLQNRTNLRRPRPSKPLNRPEGVGVLIAGKTIFPKGAGPQLSAPGQLTASNLQMLSGPFAILRPAYKATGRIGYAQEGKPTSEDYAFGTGFLVTPNHVITNRHVHGFYSEYLTGDDCGGIEFIAEKDKNASDFYEFDGNPPVLIPGLDIAIYTLAKTVENREPIAQIPLSTDSLDGRDIVVIGYPDTFTPDDPDLLSALEENPVFAVKRISQGQIFRHSSDIDDPYGVQAMVTKSETEEFPMPAISHNASTMTGNSGSPILDIKTGELLGVHFAGYKVFNKEEAANLAMAIEYIVRQQEAYSNLKTSTGLQTA